MKKSNGSGKCYFSLTQDGRPIKVQRTIFSECFYTMAMSELARATKEEKYKVMYVHKSMYSEQNVKLTTIVVDLKNMISFQKEALDMMNNIVHWMKVHDSALERDKLSGQTATNTMAEPMMLSCLIDQLQTMDLSLVNEYSELSTWCIQQILVHIQVPIPLLIDLQFKIYTYLQLHGLSQMLTDFRC